MQNEGTISLSDETYQGLIKLVGKRDASRFVEAVLRPYVLLAGRDNVPRIESPHLADPAQLDRFKVEIVD